MSDNCRGLFGWLFGHDFQPRYSTVPPNGSLSGGTAYESVMVIQAMTAQKYEGDVCMQCGRRVEKQSAS